MNKIWEKGEILEKSTGTLYYTGVRAIQLCVGIEFEREEKKSVF